MSTRCQVKVTGADINTSTSFTLYHHCDGYPSYMLPTIAKGFIDSWQAERIGKAVAMLCAADPTGFEFEHGNELHADIEYYYVVNIPGWTIDAYSSPLDANSISDMTLIGKYSVKEAANYTD